MSFVDFKTGWAIDERNQLSHTQDAGATWQVQALGDNQVNSLSFVDHNTGWIAGENGMIRKTTDGGKTWRVQDSGTSEWINKIDFFNTESGIFITANKVFRSQDGGESWQAVSGLSGTQGLSFFKSDGALFFTPGSSSQPVLLDSGMASRVQGYASHLNINGVAFQDENTGYLYGESLYKTTDGGRSWQALSGLTTNEDILRVGRDRGQIYSMAFANAQEGLLMTDKRVFYYTTDGGETWAKSSLTMPSGGVSGFVAIYHMQLFGSLNQGWAFANGVGSGVAQGTGVLYRLGRP